MRELKIKNFLELNKEFFNQSDTVVIKNFLNSLSDENLESLAFLKFSDPKIYFAISFFGGGLGIDRFLIGDIGVGILKFCLNWITLFIPYIIDLFLIQKRVKTKNLEKLMSLV